MVDVVRGRQYERQQAYDRPPRRMEAVGLGAQPVVPMPRGPRRSNEELLRTPMTREFIRSITAEEICVVHDVGLSGLNGRRINFQEQQGDMETEAIETVRLRDTEAENEEEEMARGEQQHEEDFQL